MRREHVLRIACGEKRADAERAPESIVRCDTGVRLVGVDTLRRQHRLRVQQVVEAKVRLAVELATVHLIGQGVHKGVAEHRRTDLVDLAKPCIIPSCERHMRPARLIEKRLHIGLLGGLRHASRSGKSADANLRRRRAGGPSKLRVRGTHGELVRSTGSHRYFCVEKRLRSARRSTQAHVGGVARPRLSALPRVQAAKHVQRPPRHGAIRWIAKSARRRPGRCVRQSRVWE